jgi:hypothetical protein
MTTPPVTFATLSAGTQPAALLDENFNATTLVVSTIAALRANTNAALLAVFVLGYFAAGDGGGGLYEVTTTAAADNSGSVIEDAASLKWQLWGEARKVEQWGVVGGDATFSSAHATANKTAIDNMFEYGPFNLSWLTPGYYCTTGHVMPGATPHRFEGFGDSEVNCLLGSGIAYVWVADIGADPFLASNHVVLQGGTVGSGTGNETWWDLGTLSVVANDPTTVNAVAIPGNNQTGANAAAFTYGASGPALYRGFSGLQLGWQNGNRWDNLELQGYKASLAMGSEVNIAAGGIVQKVWMRSIILEGYDVTHSTGIYQYNGTGNNVHQSNLFSGFTIEATQSGILTAPNAGAQIFEAFHYENVNANSLGFVLTEGAGASSYFNQWTVGQANAEAQILNQMGPNSLADLGPYRYTNVAGGSGGVVAMRFRSTSGSMPLGDYGSDANFLYVGVGSAGPTKYVPLITSADTLTAVGTNQATALQLAATMNHITTAGSGTGVALIPAIANTICTIFQNGASPITTYGAIGSSDTIDGIAGSTGVTLTNGKRCNYYCLTTGKWLSAQLGVTSA